MVRSRLYAGNPEYPPLLPVFLSVPLSTMRGMGSDNVWGADNQQERLSIGWVVGFVDGEGCFSCPIYRCDVMTLGWQVRPEFAVVARGVEQRCSGGPATLLRMRKGFSESAPRQSPGGSLPILRTAVWGSAGRDRPVLPGVPAEDLEAEQLRAIRPGGRADVVTPTLVG